MKLRVIRILYILTFFWSADLFAADIDVTVYVDDGYPPYTFLDKGRANGVYVKILEKAFANMKGYNVDIEAVPWQRGKRLLEVGKGFALVPPYFHGHDWPYIWPYSLPILNETVVVMCRDKILERPRPVWPDDYIGLKIGINTGFDGYGGDRFRKLVKDGKIQLSEVHTTEQNILMLSRGRTDCYMITRLSYAWEIGRLKAAGKIDGMSYSKIKEGAVLQVDPGYMGFTDKDNGKFPFKQDFVKQFDIQIYKMTKSGEIQRIIDGFRH
jgi:polar amino acid transport system substrate-binding protein